MNTCHLTMICMQASKLPFMKTIWELTTLARLEPGQHAPNAKCHALKLHWFCVKSKQLQDGICDIKTMKISTKEKMPTC